MNNYSFINSPMLGDCICAKCTQCHAISLFRTSMEEIKRLQDGALMQVAFPNLLPGQRELLISGYCNECFDGMFKDRPQTAYAEFQPPPMQVDPVALAALFIQPIPTNHDGIPECVDVAVTEMEYEGTTITPERAIDLYMKWHGIHGYPVHNYLMDLLTVANSLRPIAQAK